MERIKCFKRGCEKPAEFKIESWWLFGEWRWEGFACAEHANEWEENFIKDQSEGWISHGMRYRIREIRGMD